MLTVLKYMFYAYAIAWLVSWLIIGIRVRLYFAQLDRLERTK